jgi:galactose mutarotase-like enzyme
MIVRIGDEIDGVSIDTSAGGRLASWVMAGRERLLVEPAAGIAPSLGWGCYLMAPFVGRVHQGWVDWAGRKIRLRLNGGHHSIQGAVFDSEWTVTSKTAASVSLSCPLDPSKWPFRGTVTQRIAIARGLMRLDAEIAADEAMPAALGWHPWFRNPGGHLCVGVKGDKVLTLQPDLIPTGELTPVDRRTDLRAGPNLAGHRLDDVYPAVRSPVVITWPDIELTMSFARPVGVAVVHTHPQAVCVGLATAWPDSIRLARAGHAGTGLVSLPAGEKLSAAASCSWVVRPAVQPVDRRLLSRS